MCINFHTHTYTHTTGQYERAYRTDPDNYLLCLCISLVYLSLASQRRHSLIKNTNALVVQAMAFLHKYYVLRGPCQETLYNIGRAFHQLGEVFLLYLLN